MNCKYSRPSRIKIFYRSKTKLKTLQPSLKVLRQTGRPSLNFSEPFLFGENMKMVADVNVWKNYKTNLWTTLGWGGVYVSNLSEMTPFFNDLSWFCRTRRWAFVLTLCGFSYVCTMGSWWPEWTHIVQKLIQHLRKSGKDFVKCQIWKPIKKIIHNKMRSNGRVEKWLNTK